jgi:hypothetical protein
VPQRVEGVETVKPCLHLPGPEFERYLTESYSWPQRSSKTEERCPQCAQGAHLIVTYVSPDLGSSEGLRPPQGEPPASEHRPQYLRASSDPSTNSSPRFRFSEGGLYDGSI